MLCSQCCIYCVSCCNYIQTRTTAARREGLAPLSVESLLDLLSFLFKRDSCLDSPGLATALQALHCRYITNNNTSSSSTNSSSVAYAFEPPALLSAFLPAKGVAEAYALKAEDKLRAYFDNIVANSTAALPAGLGADVEGVQVRTAYTVPSCTIITKTAV
jgi:hypothetical protein